MLRSVMKEMQLVKNNKRRNLPFPGLITTICEKNGFPTSESGYAPLIEPFDEKRTTLLIEIHEKAAKAELRRRGGANPPQGAFNMNSFNEFVNNYQMGSQDNVRRRNEMNDMGRRLEWNDHVSYLHNYQEISYHQENTRGYSHYEYPPYYPPPQLYPPPGVNPSQHYQGYQGFYPPPPPGGSSSRSTT